MALKPISVTRYWEMVKIEEERASVYDGMLILRNARDHLRDDVDLASWPESKPAMDQLGPLIGQLENQNKDLGERASALWGQILEIDGARLTSEEITRQQLDIASGQDWLQRIMKHIDTIVLDEESKGEITTAFMALSWELNSESHRLREVQRKHQRLQADKLALQGLGPAS